MQLRTDELPFYEAALYELVKKQSGRTTTAEICKQTRMSRATALKYLEVLKAKGVLGSEWVGPSKIWWPIERCPICNTILRPSVVLVCQNCKTNKIKGEQKT